MIIFAVSADKRGGKRMHERKIIHIDMDAFFAAVEQRENPDLRGKPIAVGFDGPRSVVSTASYEARRFGVHSAMPMATAKQLCPELIVVECHFSLYKEISAQVHDIFREYTDIIEPLSIDEAFLDVTENKKGIVLARDIAIGIKDEIRLRTGLTASAGVSYNKFLAKVASDFRKPDGITVVHPTRALDFIAKLPIEDFWGVGPKTAEKMHSLGIFNGQQLREQSLSSLTMNFGKAGRIYHDFARGIDNRPVQTTRIRKSIGCEETYPTDLYRFDDILSAIDDLVDDLVERLRKRDFKGRTLTLKVKFHDFTQITRSTSRSGLRSTGLYFGSTDDNDEFFTTHEDIRLNALELLTHVNYSEEHQIRLLGLSVSNPVLPDTYPSLFD